VDYFSGIVALQGVGTAAKVQHLQSLQILKIQRN